MGTPQANRLFSEESERPQMDADENQPSSVTLFAGRQG